MKHFLRPIGAHKGLWEQNEKLSFMKGSAWISQSRRGVWKEYSKPEMKVILVKVNGFQHLS